MYIKSVLKDEAKKWESMSAIMEYGLGDVGGRSFEGLVHSLFKGPTMVTFTSEARESVKIEHKGWTWYNKGNQVEASSYYKTMHSFLTIDSLIMGLEGKMDVFQISTYGG